MRLNRLTSFCAAALTLSVSLLAADPQTVSFNRDVRPILSDHCFACHGFDEKKREADLRLDTAVGATAVHDGTAAIVPGDPDRSELWLRINGDEDSVMPPPEFHKPLTAEQKDILRRWIQQGAGYQKHWSFLAPQQSPVPDVDDVSNPIDAFLREKLEQHNLRPAERADRATLIRRLTLDLTGLPPTPEEVETFVNSRSPHAYETLVDDLQGRVTYGEHMARYWLDLARYADTHGLHLDNERSMWPYRDWVVRAMNDNISFADFTRWQLAGDLLPDPTTDQLIASGFNRCNVTTSEGGSINKEWVYRYAVDRTATAVEVWMGLTGGCAVCHDHKFDPLSTKEFYSLYAFFHSAADPAMDGNKIDTPPILKLTSDKDKDRLNELRRQIALLDDQIDQAVAAINYVDPATLDERPSPVVTKDVWFEDGFPSGTRPQSNGGPLTLVKKDDGPVYSGEVALTRTSTGLNQDFYSGGATFTIPPAGQFFAWCFLNSDNPPEAIMLQFHTGGWNNRAVWGNADRIPYGKPGTTEKVNMGPLPKTGEWVALKFPAAKIGLKPGTKVTGYAFTEFGGTITWDHLGVSSSVDPVSSPNYSWQVWTTSFNQRRRELPEALRREFQGRKPADWTAEETARMRKHWLTSVYHGADEQLNPLRARRAQVERHVGEIDQAAPVTLVMADLKEARKSYVMVRGAYDNPGEQVTRNVPAFLPALGQRPEGRDYNRLDLANWLVNGQHPLTARVTVNRFWQQFFGTGLVDTSADFGSQGMPPSHPDLLDWLSVQFVRDGWDMKKLVKRIVTSHAYRQSSRVSPEVLAADPANRLLARGPRLRLDAEVLRDQALFVSGLLVPTIGGPGVKPYQPPNIWEPVGFGNSNTRYYKQGTGEDLYRRSLYTFLKRTAPPPFMSSFDAPNREQSCSVRGRSNTPMQALQLMNDVQHVEAARGLAERMMTEGGSSLQDRIEWAWLVVTSRRPQDSEAQIAIDAWRSHFQQFTKNPDKAKQLIAYGDSSPADQLPAPELAAYTLTANLLLNLDEAICKN